MSEHSTEPAGVDRCLLEDHIRGRCQHAKPEPDAGHTALAAPASEDEGLRDHAYYFGFTQTGVGIIDRILSEVCRAGKGYHSTEFWQDEDPRVNGGKSYEDSIQAAADAAAAAIRQATNPPTSPTGADQ